MELVVDGYIYQHNTHGGNLRIYNETLPRMCELDENLAITVAAARPLRAPLPKHPRIQHKGLIPIDRLLQPNRLWWRSKPAIRAWMQRVQIGKSNGRIWHSTYYTLPMRWDGPVVIFALDMIYELFPHLFREPLDQFIREQQKRSVLAADMVLCISNTTKNDVQRIYGVSSEKLKVIHLAHSPIFRPLARSENVVQPPAPKPYLLYIGSRAHYKNFYGLLEGYHNWSCSKEVDLVVVGSRWTDAESRLISNYSLQDQVRLLSHVDDSTLCGLYNQAMALVYPSLYEGFGIPLLEALACGCPVVASDIPASREIGSEFLTYFQLGSLESMISAMNQVYFHNRDAERVKGGQEWVRQFSWDLSAQRMLAAYRSLKLSGETFNR